MIVSRRPEAAADQHFLRELILSTVLRDLGADAWPEPMRSKLLDVQCTGRLQGIRSNYPAAVSEIIAADGCDVGWLVVADLADHVRLVEIMLVEDYRSRGIGSEIVRQVLVAGAAAGKPVRLRVDVLNDGAARLYRNLGFQRIGGDELHHSMEWRATS